MNEQQTEAVSSPAEHVDPFQGQQPTMAEYDSYRSTGELPTRFKAADTEPNDAPEQTVDSEGDEPQIAADSEPDDEAQEPPKPVSPAQKRILQLLAENKELKRKAEAAAKPDVTPGSSPAPANQPAKPPQNYQEWRKDFKPSQWVEDYGKQNPTASYEDATAAMSDFLDERRSEFKAREDARKAEVKEIQAKVSEAKARYENFDEVTKPFVDRLLSDTDVSPIVKRMLNDSDVWAELAFTLAGDDKFMAIATGPPGKAIRYVARVESLIEEELSKTGKTADETNGKAPERKVTTAPKPPSPVSGAAASKAFDASDTSLSADEWFRKRNAQLERRKS